MSSLYYSITMLKTPALKPIGPCYGLNTISTPKACVLKVWFPAAGGIERLLDLEGTSFIRGLWH